jgi:2-methylcitrate dehydratase PrpD
LHLRKEHHLSHEDIAEIICTTSVGQKRNFEPEDIKYAPPNGYSAISSIPYMVSATLVEGKLTLREVTDEKVKDPKILKLIQKVKRSEDLFYKDYQNAAVEIRLRDGRIFKRAQTDAVGSPEIPAPREMIEAKFRSNADQWMSDRNLDKIIETVQDFENLNDIRVLTALLQTVGKVK